jgi:hypothetical protein
MNGPILDKTFSCPIAWVLHQDTSRSSALQDEVQDVLQAHAEAAAAYTQGLDQPDFFPFVSMPGGTEVRDLPSGGRLFSLSDGTFVVSQSEGVFQYLGSDGTCETPVREAGFLITQDGRRFELEMRQGSMNEESGIEGLPNDSYIEEVSHGRFNVNLSNGQRLIVSHPDALAILVNPNGSLFIIGPGRLEGIGEKLETHLAPGGTRGFYTKWGLRGSIDPSGATYLSLPNGTDLVIRFRENPGPKQEVASTTRPSLNDVIGGTFNV